MVLPLLCLGTILALSCPPSCQLSCSPPPSSGSVGAAWFHPLQPLYDGPCAVLHQGPRSFTVQVGSRYEVVALSRLKACMAVDATPGSPCRRGRPPVSRPGGLVATKGVSFSDPLVYSPSPSSAPPRDGPGTVFLPSEEVFARPGPAAPSQPPQTRYLSRQRAPPKRLDF
jgi:hypothetical protein